MLAFIIAGLTTGSVYGLAGVGLVLTYKTSGVFNFAHGALATVSAYVFYTLHVQHHWPWPLAAILCVFVLGPVLGIATERIARVLSRASLAVRVASTIGVLLIVQAGIVLIYGTTVTRSVPPFLGTHALRIGGAVVTTDRLVVFIVGATATAALYIYFRLARMGVAMHAVVDNPDLLDVSGTSPVVVRRWAWMIGVSFASASGLMLVPFISLDSITLTFLVVAAFGAAAVGAFNSLPGTYFGGLAIGVLASLASKYFTTGLLSGLSTSLPFVVLFVVLLIAPRRRLAERSPVVPRGSPVWTTPWQIQSCFAAALLVLLLLVPGFAGIHLADYSRFLAIAIMFLSLGLLVRTSGQVSLCHISFMAIGACAFSHLAVDHGWPWGLALLTAGVITVPIGALLSIPAIRLSGLYLALSTFGFGILLQYMFYTQDYMFGSLGLGLSIPHPSVRSIGLTDSDRSYYYLVLIVALTCTLAVVAITRGRLGRLLRALADSPKALATSGTSIDVTRVLVFCISAFLASVAGVLEAGALGQVNGDAYQPIDSLIYFALIIISLGGVPWYAVGAAAGLVIIPSYITGSNTSNWLQVLFGVGAVLYALTPPSRRGVPAAAQRMFDRLVPRPGEHTDRLVRQSRDDGRPASVAPVLAGKLQVSQLRVAFGGLIAVDGVNIDAPTGAITGLIGPNGAGKTTTFDACSGLTRPSGGRVIFNGKDISRSSPASRARSGLGRTFQQMELCDTLTVWQNVALGREASYAGPNALRHLASTRTSAHRVREATLDALKQCDLLPLADIIVESLSTGQRRLVELARCLAGGFTVLLLDEPSSGLDVQETARFGRALQRVVAERGVGILLVEHDMALVTEICEYIYVLDFGKPIFEGTATEVMASPIVQEAYLGGDHRASVARDEGASPMTEVSL